MKRLFGICAAAAALHTTTASAQVVTQPLGSEPGFNWRVGIDLVHDDNVYRTAALEESDGYLTVAPELAWYGFKGAHQFDVLLSGALRRYQDQDVLDTDEWRIRGHALLDHSARLNTDYTLGFEDGVEQPGETDQVQLPGREPNDFERWNGAWVITYGSDDAAGQLKGQVRLSEVNYLNNDQEFRDQETTGFTGTFFYRIAPRTRLLLEVDYTDYDFGETDAFGSNQSGDQMRYLGGVTWEATANTTGEFRIGYRDRSFDDPNFTDLSGLALDLSMTWTPSELATVRVRANEDNQSSAVQGVGGYVRQLFGVDLTRSTSARSRLVADASFETLEFEGGLGRDDDRWSAGVGFEYDLTSRLSTRVEYRYEDRDSNFALFNFEANVIMLSFTLSPPV